LILYIFPFRFISARPLYTITCLGPQEKMNEPKRLTFISIGAPQDIDAVPLRRCIRSRAARTGWKTITTKSNSESTNALPERRLRQGSEGRTASTKMRQLPANGQSHRSDNARHLPDPRSLGVSLGDPVMSYPVPFQAWFPFVIDFCECLF
jgi:hypothetical protein